MPIIPRVGRQTPSIRFVIIAIYAVLILGSVTMIYPFMLMIAHSISSEVDMNDYKAIPRYLRNDGVLFRKYLAEKYNPRFISFMNDQYGTNYARYKDVDKPAALNDRLMADWFAFKKQLPLKYKMFSFSSRGERDVIGKVHRLFQDYARKKYGSIERINAAYNTNLTYLRSLRVPDIKLLSRDWYPPTDQRWADWQDLKSTLPENYLFPASGEGKWATFLRSRYKDLLDSINTAYGASFTSFAEVPLPEKPPAGKFQQADYEEFVRHYWPFRFMEFKPQLKSLYQKFLKNKYKTIDEFNRIHKTGAAAFDGLALPSDFETKGISLVDFTEFLETAPLEYIEVMTVERLYRRQVLKKYGSLEALNTAYGTGFKDLYDLRARYLEQDYVEMMDQKNKVRVEFVTRNYYEVLDYIVFHGRALFVTVIYISVIILTQLTVNPFCAYALSRFKLSYSYKVILFLLVTMAFPSEVTMIPNFLLMKQLNMLNTFWALFLPGMANGFFIFILKGFFDSLPAELYEAANLDGANEFTVYWRITFPMAKPVLAYMMLSAFSFAYSNFWFAMIICQDSEMWTLMVWLYEMQNWAPPYLITAGMTVAALPSLLMFIFCQNIIMRGMVLPVSH